MFFVRCVIIPRIYGGKLLFFQYFCPTHVLFFVEIPFQCLLMKKSLILVDKTMWINEENPQKYILLPLDFWQKQSISSYEKIREFSRILNAKLFRVVRLSITHNFEKKFSRFGTRQSQNIGNFKFDLILEPINSRISRSSKKIINKSIISYKCISYNFRGRKIWWKLSLIKY